MRRHWFEPNGERGGGDPPAIAFLYADGRGGEHATRHLDGFRGTLQVDGYAGYRTLTDPRRPGGPVTLAFCWAGRAPGDGVGGRARSPGVAQRAAGVTLAAIAGLRRRFGLQDLEPNGDDDDR